MLPSYRSHRVRFLIRSNKTESVRIHFGLGKAAAAEVEIAWPSGGKERVQIAPVNRIVTVVEGKGITSG